MFYDLVNIFDKINSLSSLNKLAKVKDKNKVNLFYNFPYNFLRRKFH